MNEAQMLMMRMDASGTVTYVGNDVVAVSGLAEKDWLGGHHDARLHPDTPDAVRTAMWRILQGGRPWTGLLRYRGTNPDGYWVRACMTPVRQDGAVCGFVGVGHGPTEAEVAEAGARFAKIAAGAPVVEASTWQRVSGYLLDRPLAAKISVALGGILLLLVTGMSLSGIVLFWEPLPGGDAAPLPVRDAAPGSPSRMRGLAVGLLLSGSVLLVVFGARVTDYAALAAARLHAPVQVEAVVLEESRR